MFKKIGLTLIAFLAAGSIAAFAGMWPNFPIIGGASYCSSTVNGVCVNTVPAGPALTGNETIPADTNASGGQSPQTALLSLADVHALPLAVQVVTQSPSVAGATDISASNISGGILYTSTATITQASITLPALPVDKQTYSIASNRTITLLVVNAGGTNSMGGNTKPTVLTASLTAPQGYEFMFNLADTSWYRLR